MMDGRYLVVVVSVSSPRERRRESHDVPRLKVLVMEVRGWIVDGERAAVVIG